MLRRWFRQLLRQGGRGLTEEEAERFEEEALSHLDALYRTALRFTRNPQDAEDLVQEAYLKVFKFADRFEPGTNLRAWMFRILTNTFFNRYRETAREPGQTSLDDLEEFYVYNRLAAVEGKNLSASAEDQALAQFVDVDVKRALDDLPEAYRVPILLHDVEGFAYKEIAEMVSVPIGTVMSRLSRGRKILQRSLWRYAREPSQGKEEGVS